MESAKTLLINSRDRISGTTTDFRYAFRDSIKFSNVKLSSVFIPNTYYNITSNAVFVMNDGLGGTFTISPGNYTIGELTLNIQNQLQVFDVNYTVTYDPIIMRVTFRNTTPVNFDLNFVGQSEAARALGFAETNITASSLHIGPNVPQLVDTEFIIDIPEFGILVDTPNVRGVFVVHNPVVRGDYMHYFDGQYNQTDFRDEFNKNTIDIKLRKLDGSILDLRGGDWSMILRLNENSQEGTIPLFH